MKNIKLKITVLSAFAVAASLVFAGCNTGQLVSTEQEVNVGRQAAQRFESENRVVTGTAAARRVENISRPILNHRQRTNVTYNIRLVQNNEVNAVALPGGWIYIYTGLLDFVDRSTIPGGFPGNVTGDDLLAAVIAHEIGHVEARHHAKMMGRSALYGIAISTLTEGNTEQWANFFANVHLLQYSRADENEADRIGVTYSNKAGYNPYGMVAFLTLLNQQSSRSGGDLQRIFSTHPPTPERIERTQRLADEVSGN